MLAHIKSSEYTPSVREPGYPLLVSLLLYLVDEAWDRDWHGETLFLDTQTEIGLTVRPRMYRAVLMDQDVLHRVVQPSVLAQGPRYSVVWKLAMLPKNPGQVRLVAIYHVFCSSQSDLWGIS